jgi:hypothetical protein
MRVSILRHFPHSRNGVEILHAKAGAEDDIADHLVAGLEAEGFVRRIVKDVEPKTSVAPPAARIKQTKWRR